MDRLFRRIIDGYFSELGGAVVEATVPISQALINEVIQSTLKGHKPIAALQVSVLPENRISANLKTTLLPWALNLKLKLDTSVDFASHGSPKIRAWLENNRLLGSLGTLFNALPEGIKLYGNQVVVDLGAFLRTPEQRRYLELVKSVGIRTEEGKLTLDILAAVE